MEQTKDILNDRIIQLLSAIVGTSPDKWIVSEEPKQTEEPKQAEESDGHKLNYEDTKVLISLAKRYYTMLYELESKYNIVTSSLISGALDDLILKFASLYGGPTFAYNWEDIDWTQPIQDIYIDLIRNE